MSRRREAQKRSVPPDPLYQSEFVSRFINRLMLHGKKTKAEKIFYSSLLAIQQKLLKNPNKDTMQKNDAEYPKKGVDVFWKAVANVTPEVEVRSRRVGGATYQVPMEVSDTRKSSLTIRWIVFASRSRKEKGMVDRLASELWDAFNKTGGAFKKKEEVFRMAEANRAFAHYRW